MKALPILDQLSSPTALKRLSDEQLEDLAEEIRYRIKETVSHTGGHLASNLGVVELTLALHRIFDFTTDRLLWDVGHQAYPHKLVTGRADRFHTNRTKGGISGFPDPKESPFDMAKVGHSSTAISTGVGIAEADRRQDVKRHTVVVVGDGALTGGMCFEGMINAGDLQTPMIVILNDNGNFIDAPVGSLHQYLDQVRTGRYYHKIRDRLLNVLKKIPYGDNFERLAEHAESAAHKLISPGYIFEDLGFKYFGPVDGHDRGAVERMLSAVAKLDGPILVHVHTEKGGGWQPSQDDPLAFHGPKGFDLDTGLFHPKPPSRATYSQVMSETLAEMAAEDDQLVAITAAMPSGTMLRQFAEQFPDRMYDVGICEQHSFAFAQGLAVAGMRPILGHYSTFAQRGYDQFFQEVIVQRDLGIVITLDRGGLVGEDGETHQGLYDIGWSRVLPGTVLLAPKDGPELAAMLRWCHAERTNPQTRAAAYLVRYPKEEIPNLDWGLEQPAPITLGKAEVLCRGQSDEPKLMIWAYGAMVHRAWDAIQLLGDQAEQITLVNARFAKPIDQELLTDLAIDHDRMMTIEDHALPAGFGSAVAEAVSDAGIHDLQITRCGVSDELISHAKRAEQMVDQGLDPEGLAVTIRRLIAAEDKPIPFALRPA